MTARGVLYVHSSPPALCPHVEWAASGVLGVRVSLDWTPQSASPGTMRAEVCWEGRPGTAALIASAMRGWDRVRYEVTEDPSEDCDGSRFMWTPTLGMFAGVTGVEGDILVSEHRLRAAVVAASDGRTTLQREVDRLLGTPWDEELEPFRYAGEGAPVRWLHAAM
ncbi:MAG TPA: DUF3145 domain-containing protein [Streptosporangiales bacterium]